MDMVTLIARLGNIVSLFVLVFSFLLFYYYTAEFFQSLFAAIICFVMVWGSFLVVRWIVESLKKQ
jgi:hypothetical protein